MSILIGFLTVILVVNCVFLILLVLIQLPKKEAGAGVAFGGGATEALFGAGSGTVLTKVTKYCAGLFMGLALLLSLLNAHVAQNRDRSLENALQRKAAAQAPAPAPATAPGVSLPTPTLQLTTTNAEPAPALATTSAPAATTPAPATTATSAPAAPTPAQP
jgi:preprotein translocase subunit SecG